VDAQVALENRRGACDRAMSETEKTEKKIVRGKNGGYRPGSGRKPLMDKAEIERVKQLIAQHGLQIDPNDLEKRTRLLRLLDALYEKGVERKDVQAIKEYLDRQLGKSKEHIEHTGDLPFNLTIVQKQ
jgi:hypothetical protein